ncbi:nucleotidyltransferase family protein [Aliarcobacter cryaerophilus]|uniref:nucleotidyltransferase family protein n=1 Tax=Aliarcobacter cryaerophilus TaxID=28198 RepID=UPI0021B609B3|nr:nucleotidyltransferase family protein [Aliarcobacter cryaerophilus]MCT7516363.1 nucleotidyltransferase family protein [Aliarcobacter cryaerophilus]
MKAIILAGGFGKRLQNVVSDVPKPMAEINGKPFLVYLFDYLSLYGITEVLISVYYKAEKIKEYFDTKYKAINIQYIQESDPLGTGGAIKEALKTLKISEKYILVLNGDSLFNIDLYQLEKKTKEKNADIVIALKQMKNYSRYGTVLLDNDKITDFKEKSFHEEGYINAGIYCIKKDLFDHIVTEKVFSFEEFLEKHIQTLALYSYISNNSYFIDIGVPNDYKKAQSDFKELF